MNLVCADMVAINFMISARYIAYGITGILIFKVPNLFGRKWTIAITSLFIIIAQFLMIFVPTYEARLIGFILFGISMLKASLPYVYISELVPPENTSTTASLMTSYDSSTLVFLNIFFLLISRDWFPITLIMTIISMFALFVAIFLIPESPSWLLSQGRVEDAINAFNKMASINKVSYRIP